jgi:hypothetical protein
MAFLFSLETEDGQRAGPNCQGHLTFPVYNNRQTCGGIVKGAPWKQRPVLVPSPGSLPKVNLVVAAMGRGGSLLR